jgi:hypothetical protein
MSKLCEQCRHIRRADRAVLEDLARPAASASAQAAMNSLVGELTAAQRLEELAFKRQGGASLARRPLLHDWCAAQSQIKERDYFFCDWLQTPSCGQFQCRQPKAGCERCETGHGACAAGRNGIAVREVPLPAAPQPKPAVSSVQPATARTAQAKVVDGKPVAAKSPAAKPVEAQPGAAKPLAARPTGAPWSLPLGTAYDLWPTSRAMDGSFRSGSFEIDYELHQVDQTPAIRGKGLAQTYLMFGGPGAGKTYYFQYLLEALLAHESRPGCLLLDPKGVLTPWLSKVLKKIGRSDSLTVLKADADQNAFNVLGNDLAPNELGRLLSEVVLAGLTGIDEGWSVLVGDLMEAASVIISAEEPLTATRLLGDILYRKTYRYPDGKVVPEYPVVIRARRVAKKTKNVDVRIACDRIADYFASTEPRQRRFVRQIIERTLGDLTSPKWNYLSKAGDSSVYADIISRGRVVSVAVGQESPAFQRSMTTLLKAIFQQAVLADLSKRGAGEKPFFILACDEYAQAVTEGETGLISDSRFFSLSREAGCLSLLALQSLATGRSRFDASMHDRWNGILGNVTVKFFMRVNDVETAEMGSALAGKRHSFVPVISQQQSAQGLSATEAVSMVEHARVPSWFLTNRLEQGYALVHGTLDGTSPPTTLFVRVPRHD